MACHVDGWYEPHVSSAGHIDNLIIEATSYSDDFDSGVAVVAEVAVDLVRTTVSSRVSAVFDYFVTERSDNLVTELIIDICARVGE